MCDIGDKKVHGERAIRLHSLSLLGALLLDTPNSLIGWERRKREIRYRSRSMCL